MLSSAVSPVARATAASAGRRSSVRCAASAQQELPIWIPGAERPSYLDGTMPGDYGFDLFGLGKGGLGTDGVLERFREAEVLHARWAMLGAAGCVTVEALGYGNWLDAATAQPQTYFGVALPWNDLSLVIAIEVAAFAFVEVARQNQEAKSLARLYPGGAFDPLGLAKDKTEEELYELQTKEVKNGRLAMVAMLGFAGQAISTKTGPLANLFEHVADPTNVNLLNNSVAVPL